MDTEKIIVSLKEWIKDQSDIPETPDNDLKQFINVAEGDLDAAKRILFNFYSLRVSGLDDLFENRDVDSDVLSTTLSLFQIFMVQKRTPEGYRVLISHAVSTETKHYDMMAQMRYFLMSLDASLVDEEPSPGHVVVFDISNLTTGHILKFSPSGIKKTSTYLQEGIPLKIQSVYLVNASSLVEIMMKTARPFINMDLLKRTYIFKAGEIEKLYEKVPKECLPKEYGGELGPSAALNELNTTKLRGLKEKFSQEEVVLKSLKEKGSS